MMKLALLFTLTLLTLGCTYATMDPETTTPD